MNAIATQAQGSTALAKMDDAAIIKVLGDSLYPGAKEASIRMVLSYCKAAGLDPMLKPVHIVPMSVKKPGGGQYDTEWRDVIMPGIGHYRTQASRSGQYVGKSEPRFGEDVTKKVGSLELTFPKSCTVTVWLLVPVMACAGTNTIGSFPLGGCGPCRLAPMAPTAGDALWICPAPSVTRVGWPVLLSTV